MRPPVAQNKSNRYTRRQVLGAAGLFAVGGGIAAGGATWRRLERGQRAATYIAKASGYDVNLPRIIAGMFDELGLTRARLRGKRVLLKPNLVETALGKQHINTHPALLIAVAEVMRQRDVAGLVVAEGQGHRRDSLLVLEESGTQLALREAKLEFVDLNHDDVEALPNAGGWTKLEKLYLPKTLLASDFIVSLPKLKTHHWAGVTCAMKNFFGVMPGLVYGWPKNVLHWHGIPQSILDINATVRPHFALVDGIIGMEGDGPIMGTPKFAGCLIAGTNLPAVDATAARIMGLNPNGVEYLRFGSGRLGPIYECNIQQRGEAIAALQSPFAILDLPHLRGIAG